MPDTSRLHPELEGPRPQCYSPEQWRIHVKQEKLIGESRPSGFCTECTYRYKHKMLTEGKCRHPQVVFVEDEHCSIVGVRPPEELYIPK